MDEHERTNIPISAELRSHRESRWFERYLLHKKIIGSAAIAGTIGSLLLQSEEIFEGTLATASFGMVYLTVRRDRILKSIEGSRQRSMGSFTPDVTDDKHSIRRILGDNLENIASGMTVPLAVLATVQTAEAFVFHSSPNAGLALVFGSLAAFGVGVDNRQRDSLRSQRNL